MWRNIGEPNVELNEPDLNVLEFQILKDLEVIRTRHD